MRKFLSAASIALLIGLVSASVNAQTVDGMLGAGEYGAARAVQTVNTEFGDNESEWNAAYGRRTNTDLLLMLTGNLQANFNKLEIFIDSSPGGTNILSTAGNDGSGVMDGMTFDNGFTPEYHIIARRGNAGSGDQFDIDFSQLGTSNFDSYIDIAGGMNDLFATSTGTGIVNLNPIQVAHNDSNTGGIVGGTGAADPIAALSVTTGLELGINLADLGSPTGPIRVMVLQNNQNHDFLSNQTLGGLPAGTGNLGANPGSLDFNNFAGDQFFTVIPEPATAGLLGLLAMTGLVSRRRK